MVVTVVKPDKNITLEQAQQRLHDHMQIATLVSQWLRTSMMSKAPGTSWADFQYHEVMGLQEHGITVTDAMTQFGEDVARSVRDAENVQRMGLRWFLSSAHATLTDGQREQHLVPVRSDIPPMGVAPEKQQREFIRYENLWKIIETDMLDEQLTIGTFTARPDGMRQVYIVLAWLVTQGRFHDALTELARMIRRVVYQSDAVTAPFRLTTPETSILVSTVILCAFLETMRTVESHDAPWAWREPLLAQDIAERIASEEFFTSIYRNMEVIYLERS